MQIEDGLAASALKNLQLDAGYGGHTQRVARIERQRNAASGQRRRVFGLTVARMSAASSPDERSDIRERFLPHVAALMRATSSLDSRALLLRSWPGRCLTTTSH